MNGPYTAAARARSNIALVKYWGKRDTQLNLPAVGSISLTLDRLATETTIRFEAGRRTDTLVLNGQAVPDQRLRATAVLDLLRECAGLRWGALIESRNNFPTGAGLASSASGFAALVVAAAAALKLHLSASELSVLARRGSGSAARSIFGGFVEWHRGERADGLDSHAAPLRAATDWPLRVLVAITNRERKTVDSSSGMNRTLHSSPFGNAWIEHQDADLDRARSAIQDRDFQALAEVSEHSCLKMHALTLSARPGLMYWNAATVECLQRVRTLRAAGIAAFFTVDAGPQVKVICEPAAVAPVRAALQDTPGVLDLIETGLGAGSEVMRTSEGATA